MRKSIKSFSVINVLVSILLVLQLIFVFTSYSFADELDQTVKEKQQKEEEASNTEEQLVEAKQYEGTLASQLSQMSNDLYLAQVNYYTAVTKMEEKEQQIIKTEAEIEEKEGEINYQTKLIEARIRNLYKNSQYSPLEYLFLSQNFNEVNSQYIYRVNILRQDKKIILDLKDKVVALNDQREKLEQEKQQLDKDKVQLEEMKKQLEAQEVYLNKQIASTRNLQSQLANQLSGLHNEIASLSAKEQEILTAKAAAAAASTSVGSKEQNGGKIAKSAPKGASGEYYSFWSYGFPHRVGMNQYGAYGRALAGQSAGEILHAYYANSVVNGADKGTNTYPIPDEIKVEGYGWISFENLYLKGIGEMPSSWPMEALKAQAIAARTYTLAYINYANYNNYNQYRNDGNARKICTNQACQVFIGHIKDDRWAQAVEETKGIVITSGGVPITAYYASTAGGATLSSQDVWGGYRAYALGVVDIDSSGKPFDGPDWGDSPWYHKAWGDDPWMTRDQIEDIINASLLPETYNGQLPAAPNGLSSEEVISKLKESQIEVVDDLKSIEVIVGSNQTESFRVYYGSTYVNIDTERFRLVYNLRSPGTNAIWSSRFDVQSN